MRLFHNQLELASSFLKIIVDPVSNVVDLIAVFIDHYPFMLLEMNSLLDWQFSQRLLITANHLVAADNLRSTEHIGLHDDWLRLNDETPILDSLLPEEFFDHIFYFIHFLVRTNSCAC